MSDYEVFVRVDGQDVYPDAHDSICLPAGLYEVCIKNTSRSLVQATLGISSPGKRLNILSDIYLEADGHMAFPQELHEDSVITASFFDSQKFACRKFTFSPARCRCGCGLCSLGGFCPNCGRNT